MKKPKNENYAAIVVEIKTLLPLATCDNVVGAQILGNQVIVGKDIKVGDIGLYFPLECQLSKEYLSANNLYRHSEMNSDTTKKGYFEDNGRIRCVKFRGHKSEGLFMPLLSLDNIEKLQTDAGHIGITFNIGDEFDEIDGVEICRKYVVKHQNGPMARNASKTKIKESKIIENQFRFHDETSMLYKNLHKINPNDLIHMSYKLHGTSGISSKILCKKKLKWYEKVLKWMGINIVDTQYDNIYASRKVIKNSDLNPNAQHYYDVDIWGLANERLKEFLTDGLTLYYEIIGYLPNGSMIQKDYDYGYSNPLEIWERDFIIKNQGEVAYNSLYLKGRDGKESMGIYIYRITYTNVSGKVFELSAKQVQDWCHYKGLNAVPQLYYGFAKDFLPIPFGLENHNWSNDAEKLQQWRDLFLAEIKAKYNEKDCYMCNIKVPEEGAVIRIEKEDFDAYKCKSNRFFERETKLLDKGESDIESEN